MDAATPAKKDDTLIGRTVCGCKIMRRVGSGGMGSTYLARQVSLERVVALKVLSPSLSANAEFLHRFRREARALGNLLHPNVVNVHDFGEEGGVCCIVMEYVDGESVADMLARTNVVAVPAAINIIRQVAEGLACAHRQQIIHCDLKPENILVTREGVAKVIDFGLAKSLRGGATRITTDGSILGTPTYMSPEQCEGIDLDARTDIYSLGATFYRMVAGRDPFEGDNAFAVMLKHKSEVAPDPRDFNPDLPTSVVDVILRMMEKPREKRYQNGSELVAALEDLRTQETAQHGVSESVANPRHDLVFLREAMEAGLLTLTQARECLAVQDEFRKSRVEEGLPTVAVKRGFLSESQVEELIERSQSREDSRRDQQIARFALDAGMATSAQITHSIQRQQPRRGARSGARLSKVLVEEGVLTQQQVVQLLLRQLKDVQRHEDEELTALVRAHRILQEADLQRCIREQQRQEAQGHHKVLRQIVVELGLVPGSQLNTLLRQEVRTEIEQFLLEREAAKSSPAATIIPEEGTLKLREIEPCPACGEPVEVGVRACPACGKVVDEARREAARKGASSLLRAKPEKKDAAHPTPAAAPKARAQVVTPTGDWEIRLASGEPSKLVSFEAVVKLAQEKRLKPQTVLRGPLTRGVWRQARHTPRLCRLFGTCHYCEGKLPPGAKTCPACSADPDKPKEE